MKIKKNLDMGAYLFADTFYKHDHLINIKK